MLTITVKRDQAPVTFRLDGRLATREVRELARVWTAAVLKRPQLTIAFDLTGVSSMDAAGKAFLARAHAHGGALIGGGLYFAPAPPTSVSTA
jgi:ABC-type transporter Mla MlaB component